MPRIIMPQDILERMASVLLICMTSAFEFVFNLCDALSNIRFINIIIFVVK